MSSAKWRVVRFGDGSFGVMTNRSGNVEYHSVGRTHKFADQESARLAADQLNGKPVMPRRCSADKFQHMTEHVTLTPNMRGALLHILVHGHTWKGAANNWEVTESGILRAMRRVAKANHP